MKALLIILLALTSIYAEAHVKWFSNYDFQERPLQFNEVTSPTFWGLLILSVVCMPLLAYVDKISEKSFVYQKIDNFFGQYAEQGPLIMRVAMGAVLLMSWQGDSVIAPEIAITHPFWGWFQFALALLLLFKETTPITGLGLIFLYFKAVSEHGYFHMLDYVIYPAIGLFLILSQVKNIKIRNLNLPILYSGLGFSLCWVALEKLVYPHWGLSVLAQAPALAMGLDHKFFLMGCAFVEFTLGYMLIICLLHRPLAITITLVFFITTSFFGKVEVVGHTMLHGALLVFIVMGPGHYYQAPIRYHKRFSVRALFGGINYLILFALLAFPYQKLSQNAYADALSRRESEASPRFEIHAGQGIPDINIKATIDEKGGWNVYLDAKNFTFTPEDANATKDTPGQGHAHIYLNGKKITRAYGNWFHIIVPKGKNKLKARLTTNTHKDFYYNGNPIEHEIEINESREVSIHDVH